MKQLFEKTKFKWYKQNIILKSVSQLRGISVGNKN